jgi:hypothetical protein
MKILLACEESQAVCMAFRERGHEAYSCDVLECSGGHPEWHIKDDVLKVMHGWRKVVFADECLYEDWDEDMECATCPNCLIDYTDCPCPGPTQEDENDEPYEPYEYTEFDDVLYARPKGFKWDMMIAFPPCTHLAVSGAHLFEQKRKDGRQQEGIDFFLALANAPIDKIAIENPVGIMSTIYRKPDCIIQPWMFGDDASKKTCLWLKNLPVLFPTHSSWKKIYSNQTPSGQNKLGPSPERARLRSKTYQGIANAFASQWG